MATEFEDVLTNQPVVIDNVRQPVPVLRHNMFSTGHIFYRDQVP